MSRNFFRDLDNLERSIASVSGKYDTYVQLDDTMHLPNDLRTLLSKAETARTTADSALRAARSEGASARLVPVEKVVRTCVTAATAFGKAATTYESRRLTTLVQVNGEADRLGKLASRMEKLARKRGLPDALPGKLIYAQETLTAAKLTCDARDVQALMQAVGAVFTAVTAAEKAAK